MARIAIEFGSEEDAKDVQEHLPATVRFVSLEYAEAGWVLTLDLPGEPGLSRSDPFYAAYAQLLGFIMLAGGRIQYGTMSVHGQVFGTEGSVTFRAV